MYKDLKSALKIFIPTESDIDNITCNFLSHSFIHSGDNLIGEMYEAWVYEYLKSWALSNSDVKSFVVKHPSLKQMVTEGLDYDKNGQIIYIRNGKKIAEYDGIFIYKDKIVFVESSVSELRSYYRKLEDRLILKRNLLVDLFQTEDIYYLMVTRPKKRSLVYRSLPHLILFTIKPPEFNNLTTKTKPLTSPEPLVSSKKLIDLKSILI